ncbi:hypothetical protein Gorai_000800 [Gossypium raimondii]|uniref:Uncharacterized protein n=1 Tax=Gossypium raimondii TaxID=29730 RepID=A0A7J8PEG8_GOSRA|nr:hypothetical protein [Gossypium raimondii]
MTKLSFTICADVDLSSATLVEPSGVTRNQHVPVQYGMSLTLYIIDKGGNNRTWYRMLSYPLMKEALLGHCLHILI